MTDDIVKQLRIRTPGYLMPEFAAAVKRVMERMEGKGHDPILFETLRLPALQAEYFRRKTSKQKDVLRSAHGHGIGADIISASDGWHFSPEWKKDLEEACKAEGLTCGGKWKSPQDWPHVQPGAIPGVIPDALVAAFNAGGIAASWDYVRSLS
jgi:hypothetical protein